MSNAAYQIYEQALKQQHSRNEARRIRIRVAEARQNPHSASLRWPFELLQNALDAGPRNGNHFVTILIRREQSKIVFEHDGAPFTSTELAALLSGGSSKEFESEVTTGRFGTGFLVTHVLAERTTLQGLLDVETGYEHFCLNLDRSGDEETILENIQACNEAIRTAQPITDITIIPSASFEYPIVDSNMLELGFDALRQALPYLYATRRNLGCIGFYTEEHGSETWIAGEISKEQFDNGCIEYRPIQINRNGSVLPEIRIYRFTTQHNTAALVLVEKTIEGWKMRFPEKDAPRIYREYPLRGSGFLPINFVLDGKFEPDQERNKLQMGDTDKNLLVNAFDACILAVKYALHQNWTDSYLLAQVSKPHTAFDSTDSDEKQWWVEQLAAFANSLAVLPIWTLASAVRLEADNQAREMMGWRRFMG